MRPDGHAMFSGKGYGPVHNIGVPGVIAAGDIGDVNDFHQGNVVPELVQSKSLSHIRIQEYLGSRGFRHSFLHAGNAVPRR
jgi:hypothetical protein